MLPEGRETVPNPVQRKRQNKAHKWQIIFANVLLLDMDWRIMGMVCRMKINNFHHSSISLCIIPCMFAVPPTHLVIWHAWHVDTYLHDDDGNLNACKALQDFPTDIQPKWMLVPHLKTVILVPDFTLDRNSAHVFVVNTQAKPAITCSLPSELITQLIPSPPSTCPDFRRAFESKFNTNHGLIN